MAHVPLDWLRRAVHVPTVRAAVERVWDNDHNLVRLYSNIFGGILMRTHGPEWVKVENSTNIEGFEYDAATRTLYVDFKNGSSYAYKDVPPQVPQDFRNVKSAGSFLATSIKGKFEFEKVAT